MEPRLKLKSHFGVKRQDPDVVFLVSESSTIVLRGHTYYAVTPFLNGQYTTTDIVSKLSGQVSPLQTLYALTRLKQKGYLVDSRADVPPAIEQLCDAWGVDVNAAMMRLNHTRVFVSSLQSIPTASFIQTLCDNHLYVTDDPTVADLCVVLTADYLDARLETLNRDFLNSKQSWLLVKPVGSHLWLGPLFAANGGACWSCLAQRLRLHRRTEALFAEELPDAQIGPPNGAILPLALTTASNLAALEILKWALQAKNSFLAEHVVTFDLHHLAVEKHTFVRRPQCPTCRDADWVVRKMQQPIVFGDDRIIAHLDGGLRAEFPSATVTRFQHHVSKITGVVEALQPRFDTHDSLMHSYTSGLNADVPVNSYDELRALMQFEDLGKGATAIQAQASALCEAIERYSSSFHGDEYRIRATFQDLGSEVIHPNVCMNFSEKQYQEAEAWNSQSHLMPFNKIPPRFDETQRIEWTPVWSLTRQAYIYLPTDYCYYRSTSESLLSIPTCSNGNAAGNTLAEAVLQGFLELAERDSVSIWWYNRLKRPGVDLASFCVPYFNDLSAYYDTLGRDLWVLDISTDLHIPAFAAISRKRDATQEDIIFGFGACLEPRSGILRALTELNQFLGLISEAQTSKRPFGNKEATRWWQTATLANQPYLAMHHDMNLKTRGDYMLPHVDSLKDAVALCVANAAQQGLETLVLDQTQPDVGLNVAKVIVPGLRHFWRRLGPGRLYDVPVKMGWLDHSLSEENLNPFSIFT